MTWSRALEVSAETCRSFRKRAFYSAYHTLGPQIRLLLLNITKRQRRIPHSRVGRLARTVLSYYRLGNASYRTYAIRLTHYSLIAFNKDLSNPYARPGPMWPIRLDII